nr:MAG TPA: hypothetical protein [Caudoviricetes sp.]
MESNTLISSLNYKRKGRQDSYPLLPYCPFISSSQTREITPVKKQIKRN